MFPREHGAYWQMILPLAAAFMAAGASLPAVLTAVAVVSAFAAHEPLLVLAGGRGARVRRQAGRRAWRWLIATAAVTAIVGVAAVVLAPAEARWSLALPVMPAVVLAHAAARGREKTWQGELTASTAFSLAAVPVCLTAGARVETALAVALPFMWVFAASTLAVRIVILRVRGGGQMAAARSTQRAVLALTALGVVLPALGAAARLLPWGGVLSAFPGLALAATLALFPPPASRLRTVGWSLVVASLVTFVLVVLSVGGQGLFAAGTA